MVLKQMLEVYDVLDDSRVTGADVAAYLKRVNPDAKLLRDLTYQQVQERDLKVMDASAITICRENSVPCIRVFGLDDPQNILRVIEGDDMGTVVHP